MKKKKIIWQLFPSYLLVTLLALAAVTFSYSKDIKKFFLDHTAIELESRAHLILPQIKTLLATGRYGDINQVVNIQAENTGTRITIILPTGEVIGDSRENPATMDGHAGRPEIAKALGGATGTSTRYSKTLQKDMMYVAIPVKFEKIVKGVIRTSVPVSNIDKKLADIRWNIVLTGLITSLVIAGISLLIASRISRPIEEMEQGARQFADGNLQHTLAIPDSAELAGLAEAMNHMAAELDWKVKSAFAQRNEIHTILASMVEGVIALSPSDRIISMNRAAAEILETPLPEKERLGLQEIIRNTALEKLIQDSRTADEPTNGDLVYHKSREKILQVQCAPLKDAEGNRIGTLLVIDDVTKLRQLESMRRDFAANVSHEIKTPLTAIKGFVETLKLHAIDDPQERARFLDIIERHVLRLTNIIDDLMRLSVIERDAMEKEAAFKKVKLIDILQAAVDCYRGQAGERDIAVRMECDPAAVLWADPSLLEQAVANLLDNAIKYSEPGGEVILSTAISRTVAVINIRDNGIGIMQKHLPRLFERFYRVDKARSRQLGGTGLGLAIVKHIAQVHGGHVTVDSTIGQGSTFSIHLPLDLNAEDQNEV